MLPKVSVVTVTYNAADYVEMTLRNVVSQNYAHLEYIVIDGNSTDATMEIIGRYKEHINILVSEPDNGIYDAMNKATHLASGEWIIFMNAGDTFDNPSVLQNVFSRNIEDNCCLIFGSLTIYDKSLRVKRLLPPPISSNNTNFPYREQMPGFHQATFYRTELLKKYPYRNAEFNIAADWASMADILDLKLPHCVVDEHIAWFQTGGLSARMSFSHLHEKEIIRGSSFSWKTKAKIVLKYRMRKFIIRILPNTISTAIRRYYFLKKFGFIDLTDKDIQRYL